MRGCEREVECFSLFERYVTLPVGTWLIALEQSSRSQCGRLLRTLQSHYFVLREKKETFSVASLQLTVQTSTPLWKRLLLVHLTFNPYPSQGGGGHIVPPPGTLPQISQERLELRT